MLAYLAIHSADGPLAEAARDTRVRRAGMGKLGVGLGWIILPPTRPVVGAPRSTQTLMHDGGTGGFRSYASVVPETGKAVVVLGSRARSVTRPRRQAHASAVSGSASMRSSAATSSGGANR